MSDSIIKDGSKMKEHLSTTRDVIQELVLVVSLVRTLTDSFGSVADLYRKLKKKGEHVKEDIKGHIKEDIQEHLAGHEHGHHRKHERSKSTGSNDERRRRHQPHFGGRSRSERRRDDSRDSDSRSIETSAPLVRAEYEHGYRYLGEKYAVGDLITRNLLQSQIISLQQTLLQIYDDILENPRHPPSFHLHRLLQTTRAARAAAINALADQHKRMLPHPPPPLPPGSFPPSLPDHAHEHPAKTPHHHHHLFCRYAVDLQIMPSLPLHDNFRPGGDSHCPACHIHIPVSPRRAWEIVKRDEACKGAEKTFLLGSRFVVKCHRAGGGYACVVCKEFGDADTVCADVRSLMDHLWREHDCAELRADESIVNRD